MPGRVLDVEVVQPGRAVGEYGTLPSGALRLAKVLCPEVPLPFDLAVVTEALTDEGEQLPVILAGTVSHPPQTQVVARLIGGLRIDESGAPYLIAVPAADGAMSQVRQATDLPQAVCAEILNHVDLRGGEPPAWLSAEALGALLHEAYLTYRRVRTADWRAASLLLPEDHDDRRL
jgi:inorganic pyrophosphatase